MTPEHVSDRTPTRAFGTLHLVLALPWWVAAALTAFLGLRSSEFQGVSTMVLGVAISLALAGLAVWTARGWWLLLTAVLGSVIAVGGAAGMGIQFIDHTPTGLTGTVWTLQNLAIYAVLISGLAAFVLGIVELGRRRRTPLREGADPASR